jgi:hypothetical protein
MTLVGGKDYGSGDVDDLGFSMAVLGLAVAGNVAGIQRDSDDEIHLSMGRMRHTRGRGKCVRMSPLQWSISCRPMNNIVLRSRSALQTVGSQYGGLHMFKPWQHERAQDTLVFDSC